METASFTARRPAASNLPSFQLPPPEPLGMHHHKYQQTNNYIHGTTHSSSQPVPAVANNILTPPAGVSHDGLSPLASSVNSGSSGSSAAGVPPYQPSAFWSNPQSGNNFTFSSAPPMTSPYAQQQQQGYINRPLYSPSMSNYPGSRNPNSPTSSEGLPPPSYESLPPFTTNIPMSGSGGQQQNLPTLAPQNSQQQQMNNQNLMNLHQSSSQAPQQAYAQQSPTQQSPNTSSAPSNRISPIQTHHSHSSMGAPHQGYSSRPSFPHYNLPTLTAPIMSNVHQPGSQMALLGGMGNMAYPQQMPGPMYGGHHPQQMTQTDKQFKCDQCAQSFSRNHDLKRHKRIHLAVKPFPCGHCEKSFSRKDALKRHILVKGCGTKPTHGTTNPNGDSQSPVDKSEVLSDSTNDDSPEMVKKELS
ncbi:c2f10378-56c0-4af7-a55a-5cb5e0201822 [Sclerotinia trifoliorum]|uniref:C2f10378-56c0-4af7-a55a-5cb5e0201822 n=1 Tax=Sclerotinia trifoliorum TaxID=28548 RepID=A0A8H2VTK7_9HELO|nr:c2f10378-56c0-4af7-a55a-5cb5e0201822 [Sclerotinia trifoliorum]